jgi:hypothetical protein
MEPGEPSAGPAADPSAGVVFCGLARNCAHALPALLEVVSAAGRALGDWAYVLLESDSYDGTANVLQAFDDRNGRGIVRSYGRLRRRFSARNERLAYLRNEYLRLSEESGYFDRCSLCVVLDLDRVNENLDPARLVTLLQETPREWAGLFANQSERYYDVWALRHPEWSPDDCWARVKNRPASMSEKDAVREFVEARMIRVPPDSERIEVESAFGGLGIYDLDMLRGCRYRGVAEDGSPVCEHVPMHAQIRKKGGRLFIEPSLINGSGVQEHKATGASRAVAWLGSVLRGNRP